MKGRGERIVLAAPWDYNSARMAEEIGADVIVIGGGTTAMMLGGRPHALGASMADVLTLTRQVAPAVERAVFYVSLPYGSFHVAKYQAVGKTALQMGNSEPVVHAHYLNHIRDKKTVAKFWNIKPKGQK